MNESASFNKTPVPPYRGVRRHFVLKDDILLIKQGYYVFFQQECHLGTFSAPYNN